MQEEKMVISFAYLVGFIICTQKLTKTEAKYCINCWEPKEKNRGS